MRGKSLPKPVVSLPVALAAALSIGAGAIIASHAGGASAALAQDAGSPAPGHGRPRMGQILMSLNLSDQQKTRIRAIMKDVRAQSQNADRETKRANYQAAFKKIDTVLTPSQRTELHAKMDAMRKERDQSSQQQ
jgi:Spy/CpxP family protein refolding chaperone